MLAKDDLEALARARYHLTTIQSVPPGVIEVENARNIIDDVLQRAGLTFEELLGLTDAVD